MPIHNYEPQIYGHVYTSMSKIQFEEIIAYSYVFIGGSTFDTTVLGCTVLLTYRVWQVNFVQRM